MLGTELAEAVPESSESFSIDIAVYSIMLAQSESLTADKAGDGRGDTELDVVQLFRGASGWASRRSLTAWRFGDVVPM